MLCPRVGRRLERIPRVGLCGTLICKVQIPAVDEGRHGGQAGGPYAARRHDGDPVQHFSNMCATHLFVRPEFSNQIAIFVKVQIFR